MKKIDLDKLAYTVEDIKNLEFNENKSGLKIAHLDFGPCEALIYDIPEGYGFSKHTHSGDIISIVLSGCIKFSDEVNSIEGGPGTLHRCGLSHGYKAEALMRTILLIFQHEGTEIIEHK